MQQPVLDAVDALVRDVVVPEIQRLQNLRRHLRTK